MSVDRFRCEDLEDTVGFKVDDEVERKVHSLRVGAKGTDLVIRGSGRFNANVFCHGVKEGIITPKEIELISRYLLVEIVSRQLEL